MNKKSTIQIIVTVLLAIIAVALTIIVLEKAGVITCCKNDVSSNTAHFHSGEEHISAHAGHKHDANCSHDHKHAEHKHDANCSHDHKHAEHKHDAICSHDHKHAEHKHDAKCSGNHDHAEHNHKH